MRIFLFIIFLFFSSAVTAQKTAESVIAIKTPASKFQFVNKQTLVAVDSELWDEAEAFVNGFAKVYRSGKLSLVNGSGKLIAPLEFDDVMNFSNKLCAVKKDGKWGFIDMAGKPVILFKYEVAFDFTHPTVTVVSANKKWHLINNKGEIIKQLDINSFYNFKNGIAKVVKENKDGTLYPDGKIVWSQAKAAVNPPIPWHPTSNNLSVPCPENIGFEFGDFTNWECFAGTVREVGNTNVITVTPSPPTIGKHKVYQRTIPSAIDYYGDFNINPPDGSNFAVKLGSEENGGQAERIRYSIHVPLNDSTFSIKYDYAVVLQSPEHEIWQQPRFISRLIDSATNTSVDCASFEYVATAGLPGFEQSPHNGGVLFKPWSSVFYSLRGYGGKTLYLEFTTADCVFTLHWGYAYVDVQTACGSPVQVQYDCVDPNATTLTAPPAFQFYNWYNSDFSRLLGTGQQLIMNPGLPINSVIWIEMIPYNNFGCRDTLLVSLNGEFDAHFDMSDPIGCAPKTYTFYNRNLPSVLTQWDFGDSNTATGDTVTYTYTIPGNYNVTMNVSAPGGCSGNAIKLITVYPTPDVIKPADIVVCNNVITGNINLTGAVTNTLFNWTNDNPFIGLFGNGTGDIPPFLTTNTGTTPIVAHITITPTLLSCTGTPQTFTITINPSPGLLQPANQILCNGSTTNAVAFTGTLSSTTFTWTNNDSSIGLAANGTGDIPAFTAINNGTTPVTAVITVRPSNGTCPGLIRIFRITVNPTPNVLLPANVSVCNNVATPAINFSGDVSGTSFSWVNDNTSIGLPASGNGDIASFTPGNPGSVPVTAMITVTPLANGCPGPSQSFTITVMPSPHVIQPANQVLCNGLATNIVNFSGSFSGTTFSWTNNDISIGLAASGIGDIPSFTAINTTNVPVTATITVTPSANGCPGPAQIFTIRVNPTPDVIQPANQNFCNATATNAINFSSATGGASFSWTNNNTLIGLAASGTGDIPSFTAINTTNVPVTATITITANANGCPSLPKNFTITVNPTPDIVQPNNQELCNGAATSTTNFAGAVGGTNFSWTNDNPSIGLAASGAGDIPSFITINLSNVAVTANISVTPDVNGCTGPSKNFTITIKPEPNVVLPNNQAVCDRSTTNAVNLTGSVSGTSFSWVNDNTAVGLVAGGIGNIPAFTAFNPGNIPVISTITITASADGCTGVPQSFIITVYPTPNVVQPSNQTLCNDARTNTVSFTGAVAGTGFSWTNDNTSIGLAASGTGDIPSFIATNPTTNPVTANITVAPSANDCPGPSQNFTITVNPTPDVLQNENQRMCNGFTTSPIIFLSAVTGTTFNWTNSAPSIGLRSGGSGNIASFTSINEGPSPVNAIITVTPVAKGCIGVPKTTTITIDPYPRIEVGNDLTLSTGTITTLTPLIQNGAIIKWAWTPAKGLSCTDCPAPEITVSNNITYSVTATNTFGCIGRDNISIFAFCKNSQVFIPNAFTPDGDGLNDVLMVRGKGIFVTNFRIFNRWGELVFQKTNFNPNDKQYGWDGKVRGIPANADVFIFTAEVVCDNGIKYTYKGNTTLLK